MWGAVVHSPSYHQCLWNDDDCVVTPDPVPVAYYVNGFVVNTELHSRTTWHRRGVRTFSKLEVNTSS